MFIKTTAGSYTGQILYSDVYCETLGCLGRSIDATGEGIDVGRDSITGKRVHRTNNRWLDEDGKSLPPKPDNLVEKPFLNKWAAIPIIGCLAGITRMVLAIFHILGHLLAAIFTCDSGHLGHAAKGVAEFVRGLIETIPIIGRIFVWIYDPPAFNPLGITFYNDRVNVECCFFIVKIYNPNQLDKIDLYFAKKGDYPFLKV